MKRIPREAQGGKGISLTLSFPVFGFVLITAYPLWGHPLLGSIYRGQSLGILNRIIAPNTSSPLETYLRIADILWFSFLFWTAWMLALGFLTGYLLRHRERLKGGFRIRVALFLSTLLALFAGGEVAVRLYDLLRFNIPLYKSIGLYRDELLGWSGKKNFGDPVTDKFKIFIAGDSFTAGGSPTMYYETLKNELNAELFVYGGTGYGTLLEFLVIDKYLDEIKPNLILLQVCANDFINNHWGLGSRSILNSHLLVRPYLDEKGGVSYWYAWKYGGIAYFMAFHSRLAYRFTVKCQGYLARLEKRGGIRSNEDTIEKLGLSFRPYRESFEVTGRIVDRIKNRIGETPLIAFTVSEGRSKDLFKEIFERRGIPFIAGVPDRILLEESKQGRFRVGDGAHWNRRGHQVAGEALLQELVDKGVVPRSRRL